MKAESHLTAHLDCFDSKLLWWRTDDEDLNTWNICRRRAVIIFFFLHLSDSDAGYKVKALDNICHANLMLQMK